MTKKELIAWLDELVEATEVYHRKEKEKERDSVISVCSCFSYTAHDKAIQFYKSVRKMADILGCGVKVVHEVFKGKEYNEISIMYKGWYLFELEDFEDE